MSEEQEAPKVERKKSSKLLVIILLAVVLGGGGFFGFKVMNAGSAKEKGPLKVGSTVELQEFLVNLADGKTFLKAGIALGIAEGMKFGHGGDGHGGGTAEPPEVRDAIIMILTSKQPSDLATTEGKEQLKREIILSLNRLLNHHSEHPKPEEKPDSSDKPTESPQQETEGNKVSEEEPNRGPVLEVYFTSFATQRY